MRHIRDIITNYKSLAKGLAEMEAEVARTKLHLHYTQLYEEVCKVVPSRSIELQAELDALITGCEIMYIKENNLAIELAKHYDVFAPTDKEVQFYLIQLRGIADTSAI